ncbi:V-type ATPase 116kDa subunit family protein [Azospirillum sp. B21]|nr:V-type ATPase 116kDa subunit family protein [Azospirillum sp. B21]
MAGLFLLASVLFSPPLLGLFGVEGTVLGVPALYAGVFGVWAVVILLAALAGRSR